jgi:hypothetical protein
MKKTLLIAALVVGAAASASAQIVSPYSTYFGENKIMYDTFKWQIYKSTHFAIYFYDREEPSLQKVASYAESAYDDISRALNFQIPKPINIIYYGTHSEFEQTNTMPGFLPENIGAFALPTRNRMVLPIDVPDAQLQKLIAHELTHVFQFEILFGGNFLRAYTSGAPQWLTEGMASYFASDEDAKDRMVLRDAVLADQVPEIAERQIYGFFAYRFGHAVFDFMESEWGRDGVRDFVFEYRGSLGPNIDRVLKRTFNISAEDFDIRFRRFLRQRYIKILTASASPRRAPRSCPCGHSPRATSAPRSRRWARTPTSSSSRAASASSSATSRRASRPSTSTSSRSGSRRDRSAASTSRSRRTGTRSRSSCAASAAASCSC